MKYLEFISPPSYPVMLKLFRYSSYSQSKNFSEQFCNGRNFLQQANASRGYGHVLHTVCNLLCCRMQEGTLEIDFERCCIAEIDVGHICNMWSLLIPTFLSYFGMVHYKYQLATYQLNSTLFFLHFATPFFSIYM